MDSQYWPLNLPGGAGFRPEAFEQLAALEAQNFWFRARNRLIVWALKKHFPNMRRYLEIGCGTGYVLAGVAQAYPAAKLVGSEIFSVGSPFAASRAKTCGRAPRASCRAGSGQ